MRTNTNLIGNGTAGNNIAQNTNIASVLSVPPGRYRVTGTGRHSLADGLKITGLPGGTIVVPGGAGDTLVFPTIVVDLTAASSNVQVALNLATGAADTAAAVLCLELMNQ